ncbi:MAG: sulfatase [Candidatus Hydrogenedentes bacterium]|nr:sulfatase [Candidatus Hydrogenedentota bacterium]
MVQIVLGMLVFLCLLAGNALAQSPAPNILFILVDDMGWNGPACYGSDLHETPNIDRLATEGVRFTQAYSASPVCSPARASILTGKHPARLHMTTWHESAVSRLSDPGTEKLAEPLTEPSLGLEYVTLAEALHTAGYQTAHVGKWHLGDAEHYPEAQGFDVNIGGTLWGAPATYWYPYQSERKTGAGILEHRYMPGLPFGVEGEYLTDRLTTEALHLLDKMQGKPFFLNLCYHNPHTPIEGKPELVAYYEQKRRDGMTHTNARYAAMVHSLDQNVGRLLQKLDELGVADNTMVIFVSDNGGFDQVRQGEQVTNNAPLRSGKGSLYEGGIRVPFIVRWPGVTPRGVTCDTPVLSTDFYPTLLDAAAVDAATVSCGVLDGVSLRPLLAHPEQPLSRDALFWHYPHYYFNTGPVTAMRWQEWKLLEYYEDGHLELYNLKDDLEERTDLAGVQPERVKEMHTRLQQWRQEVNAQAPEPNAAHAKDTKE